MRTPWQLVLPIALTACQAADTGDSMDDAPDEAAVTFHRDVSPIFARACNGCHQPDTVAPFALTEPDSAAAVAEAIVAATHSRAMPPLAVDASGECGSFRDTHWLSDDELDTIAAWSDAGAPEGDPADGPSDLGTAPDALHEVTHEVSMAEPFTAMPGGGDEYRCFVLDAPSQADAFVTDYRVVPGDARVVHHVILYASTSEESDAQARELDALDEAPGYPCFGAAGVDDFGFVAGWAPGTSVTRFPEGSGIPVIGGRSLIMQVHYFPGLEPIADQTRVELTLRDEVDHPASVLPIADLELVLPPGDPSVSTSTTLVNERDTPVLIHGMFPHMHQLGRSLRVERLEPEPGCVLDVPRWSFDFQRFYFLDEPMLAMPGDVFRLTCEYDTRERDDEVRWGDGTLDEMCLAGFYFTDA